MLDYKFHHLSSRFTAGEKTQVSVSAMTQNNVK